MIESTIFPLRVTFEQRDLLLEMAKIDGINPDRPDVMNAWVLRRLGVDA